jgi:hypothetical protein
MTGAGYLLSKIKMGPTPYRVSTRHLFAFWILKIASPKLFSVEIAHVK